MGWFYVAHLQLVCYAALLAVLQGLMLTDEFGVCILAHIAAIVYYSSKLQNEIPIKKLFKYYTTYVLCMHGLFDAIIIRYNVTTGEYRSMCIIIASWILH